MTWTLVTLLALFLLCWRWAYVQWIRPARHFRREVARLASGDTRPVVAAPGAPLFREAYRNLNHLADRLQEVTLQATHESLNLRAILGSMVEGVLIVDRSGRILLANDALLGMFRIEGSIADRSMMEVFRDVEIRRALEEALKVTEPVALYFSKEISGDSGLETRHYEMSAVELRPNPQTLPTGVLAVIHEVTSTRVLESLRRDLVVNVSHELRTPLSIIKGYVETLLDGAIDDPKLARRFLKIMHKHGERLDLLIADLLTLSRLESGNPRLHLEPVDLTRCLQIVTERMELRLNERGTKLTIDFPPDLPEVEADVHRLDQVFTNLLDNAIKYTSKSESRVTVSARRENDTVIIRIADNGPGVPLQDQPHLFERFYRVQKDRSRDAGGTGLGLSIVKHILLLHHGSVWLESRPGEGAAFHFRLPITQPSEEPARVSTPRPGRVADSPDAGS